MDNFFNFFRFAQTIEQFLNNEYGPIIKRDSEAFNLFTKFQNPENPVYPEDPVERQKFEDSLQRYNEIKDEMTNVKSGKEGLVIVRFRKSLLERYNMIITKLPTGIDEAFINKVKSCLEQFPLLKDEFAVNGFIHGNDPIVFNDLNNFVNSFNEMRQKKTFKEELKAIYNIQIVDFRAEEVKKIREFVEKNRDKIFEEFQNKTFQSFQELMNFNPEDNIALEEEQEESVFQLNPSDAETFETLPVYFQEWAKKVGYTSLAFFPLESLREFILSQNTFNENYTKSGFLRFFKEFQESVNKKDNSNNRAKCAPVVKDPNPELDQVLKSTKHPNYVQNGQNVERVVISDAMINRFEDPAFREKLAVLNHNGVYVYYLETQRQLAGESCLMDHCVGWHHIGVVEQNQEENYTMRTANNKLMVTMGVKNVGDNHFQNVEEIKYIKNQPPQDISKPFIAQWIFNHNLTVTNDSSHIKLEGLSGEDEIGIRYELACNPDDWSARNFINKNKNNPEILTKIIQMTNSSSYLNKIIELDSINTEIKKSIIYKNYCPPSTLDCLLKQVSLTPEEIIRVLNIEHISGDSLKTIIEKYQLTPENIQQILKLDNLYYVSNEISQMGIQLNQENIIKILNHPNCKKEDFLNFKDKINYQLISNLLAQKLCSGSVTTAIFESSISLNKKDILNAIQNMNSNRYVLSTIIQNTQIDEEIANAIILSSNSAASTIDELMRKFEFTPKSIALCHQVSNYGSQVYEDIYKKYKGKYTPELIDYILRSIDFNENATYVFLNYINLTEKQMIMFLKRDISSTDIKQVIEKRSDIITDRIAIALLQNPNCTYYSIFAPLERMFKNRGVPFKNFIFQHASEIFNKQNCSEYAIKNILEELGSKTENSEEQPLKLDKSIIPKVMKQLNYNTDIQSRLIQNSNFSEQQMFEFLIKPKISYHDCQFLFTAYPQTQEKNTEIFFNDKYSLAVKLYLVRNFQFNEDQRTKMINDAIESEWSYFLSYLIPGQKDLSPSNINSILSYKQITPALISLLMAHQKIDINQVEIIAGSQKTDIDTLNNIALNQEINPAIAIKILKHKNCRSQAAEGVLAKAPLPINIISKKVATKCNKHVLDFLLSKNMVEMSVVENVVESKWIHTDNSITRNILLKLSSTPGLNWETIKKILYNEIVNDNCINQIISVQNLSREQLLYIYKSTKNTITNTTIELLDKKIKFDNTFIENEIVNGDFTHELISYCLSKNKLSSKNIILYLEKQKNSTSSYHAQILSRLTFNDDETPPRKLSQKEVSLILDSRSCDYRIIENLYRGNYLKSQNLILKALTNQNIGFDMVRKLARIVSDPQLIVKHILKVPTKSKTLSWLIQDKYITDKDIPLLVKNQNVSDDELINNITTIENLSKISILSLLNANVLTPDGIENLIQYQQLDKDLILRLFQNSTLTPSLVVKLISKYKPDEKTILQILNVSRRDGLNYFAKRKLTPSIQLAILSNPSFDYDTIVALKRNKTYDKNLLQQNTDSLLNKKISKKVLELIASIPNLTPENQLQILKNPEFDYKIYYAIKDEINLEYLSQHASELLNKPDLEPNVLNIICQTTLTPEQQIVLLKQRYCNDVHIDKIKEMPTFNLSLIFEHLKEIVPVASENVLEFLFFSEGITPQQEFEILKGKSVSYKIFESIIEEDAKEELKAYMKQHALELIQNPNVPNYTIQLLMQDPLEIEPHSLALLLNKACKVYQNYYGYYANRVKNLIVSDEFHEKYPSMLPTIKQMIRTQIINFDLLCYIANSDQTPQDFLLDIIQYQKENPNYDYAENIIKRRRDLSPELQNSLSVETVTAETNWYKYIKG